MLGGVLADKWVGKFKMIVLAGGLWMIGGGMQIWATWPGYSAVSLCHLRCLLFTHHQIGSCRAFGWPGLGWHR